MKRISFLPIPIILLLRLALAADAPPLKEGFWSIHSVSTEQPSGKKRELTRSICRNHAYDDHVREMAKKIPATCKTISENSSGGTTTTETECTVQSTVVHSKTTVTTASETATHLETHATYTPPLGGMSESTMVMDQTFTGACPDGVEPGDMIGPDGKKVASWKH
jgi:hypothetical protein